MAQATGWPHWPQNRAPAGWLAWQLLQVLGSTDVPHWGQKRELDAMEAWQLGQMAVTVGSVAALRS